MTFAPPDPSQTGASAPPADDDDQTKRQALLGRLRDDRQDLVRVAGAVRDLAETLEVAQSSLAHLRRALHWVALVGGVAALTVSVRTRRRPPALVLVGISLYLARRWLAHPTRAKLASARPLPVVGPLAARDRRPAIVPVTAARSPAA